MKYEFIGIRRFFIDILAGPLSTWLLKNQMTCFRTIQNPEDLSCPDLTLNFGLTYRRSKILECTFASCPSFKFNDRFVSITFV